VRGLRNVQSNAYLISWALLNKLVMFHSSKWHAAQAAAKHAL
jgi:hypothetical protein